MRHAASTRLHLWKRGICFGTLVQRTRPAHEKHRQATRFRIPQLVWLVSGCTGALGPERPAGQAAPRGARLSVVCFGLEKNVGRSCHLLERKIATFSL
eukprot:1200681-Amphidinium_carterae.2